MFIIKTGLISDHIEKYVTGLFDGSSDLQRTVSCSVPAVDGRCHQIKRTAALYISSVVNNALHHSGNRRYKLKGRTGSGCLLCGFIEKGTGLVKRKF